jgi:hypothetical protein
MISGSWDDVLTVQNAYLLAGKLGAGEFNEQRKIVILPALFHNYEPFSPRVLTEIMNWISIQTGEDIERSSLNMIRIAAWFTGYISILLALFFGRKIVEQRQSGVGDPRISIISRRKFFTGKLWLWLASLPVTALLSGLFFMAPMGKPVINLIYVGFIGGNGLLLLFLYGRGKIPGTAGKLPFLSHKEGKNSKAILTALILTALMLIAAALYAHTGWFYVFPLNVRFVWLVVFTPFTAVGFWIGIHEARMVRQSEGSLPLLSTLGLLPFFLYALLMLAIGSLSGMLGGLQGLFILALVLIFGNLVQEVGKRPWLTAFCQALLLYWLILPQSVLF